MISIQVDTASVQAELSELSDRIGDLTKVMQTIGEIVIYQTDTAFELERSPGGESWEPSERKNRGGKTLHGDTGSLRLSFSNNAIAAAASHVVVETNVPYAAIHQFGGSTGRRHKTVLPSRPFLPDQKSIDWPEIKATLQDFLQGALR